MPLATLKVRAEYYPPNDPSYNPNHEEDGRLRATLAIMAFLPQAIADAINGVGGSSGEPLTEDQVRLDLELVHRLARNDNQAQLVLNPGMGQPPVWIRYGLRFLAQGWRSRRWAAIEAALHTALRGLVRDVPLGYWPRLDIELVPAPMIGSSSDMRCHKITSWGGASSHS